MIPPAVSTVLAIGLMGWLGVLFGGQQTALALLGLLSPRCVTLAAGRKRLMVAVGLSFLLLLLLASGARSHVPFFNFPSISTLSGTKKEHTLKHHDDTMIYSTAYAAALASGVQLTVSWLLHIPWPMDVSLITGYACTELLMAGKASAFAALGMSVLWAMSAVILCLIGYVGLDALLYRWIGRARCFSAVYAVYPVLFAASQALTLMAGLATSGWLTAAWYVWTIAFVYPAVIGVLSVVWWRHRSKRACFEKYPAVVSDFYHQAPVHTPNRSSIIPNLNHAPDIQPQNLNDDQSQGRSDGQRPSQYGSPHQHGSPHQNGSPHQHDHSLRDLESNTYYGHGGERPRRLTETADPALTLQVLRTEELLVLPLLYQTMLWAFFHTLQYPLFIGGLLWRANYDHHQGGNYGCPSWLLLVFLVAFVVGSRLKPTTRLVDHLTSFVAVTVSESWWALTATLVVQLTADACNLPGCSWTLNIVACLTTLALADSKRTWRPDLMSTASLKRLLTVLVITVLCVLGAPICKLLSLVV
jgi:hypothetical protein